ncbi:anti-sigma factor antagonist [Mycobacterium decipiens]|uniref:Anti-sigma factor antagonist n=1 Tax=Mycobacterium decipiens TaxID=1430326 RepID=A0A1X2LWK8_9MYCO|nr:anti-sigma factor antagonist [Mycobacterium decipiens]OSC41563.1 anti-anti-sigma factor [Mycobacterium decipiens]
MNPTSAGSSTTPIDGALRAASEQRGAAVIIRATGEIDAANEHTWRDLVAAAGAAATAPGPFVVDVNGLDFMGCCTFAVLADEAQRCRRRGIELRLVSQDPGVARIIQACGYGGVLPIHPTTASALSAA